MLISQFSLSEETENIELQLSSYLIIENHKLAEYAKKSHEAKKAVKMASTAADAKKLNDAKKTVKMTSTAAEASQWDGATSVK